MKIAGLTEKDIEALEQPLQYGDDFWERGKPCPAMALARAAGEEVVTRYEVDKLCEAAEGLLGLDEMEWFYGHDRQDRRRAARRVKKLVRRWREEQARRKQ